MRMLTIAAVAAALIAGANIAHSRPPSPWACEPIRELAGLHAALNRFWKSSVRLCGSRHPEESAVALPDDNVVLANPEWLEDIALDYGSSAVVGVLAHEWGHMVQGYADGAVAELHADCLAGAFMRASGFTKAQLKELERMSLDSGDLRRGDRRHGTGAERRRAVARGYKGYPRSGISKISTLCPLRYAQRTWAGLSSPSPQPGYGRRPERRSTW
jgi:hypothetical protein